MHRMGDAARSPLVWQERRERAGAWRQAAAREESQRAAEWSESLASAHAMVAEVASALVARNSGASGSSALVFLDAEGLRRGRTQKGHLPTA